MYIILNCSVPYDLAKLVTEHLKDGWLLYGNPYYSESYRMQCQAMIKESE